MSLEVLMVGGKVCPTCRRMGPVFEQVKKEYANDDGIMFRKEDVSDIISFLQDNNIDISILPSYVFLKDGCPVSVKTGAMSFEQFCEAIDDIVQ